MEHEPHEHVKLRDANGANKRPVVEMVPARRSEDGLVEVLGTPALIFGCASGDLLRVDDEGNFAIIERGGNVAVQLFADTEFSDADIAQLCTAFSAHGALVESPRPARFAVVTVPVTVGFPAIKEAVSSFLAGREHQEWYFGNVYDEDGTTLDWWL